MWFMQRIAKPMTMNSAISTFNVFLFSLYSMMLFDERIKPSQKKGKKTMILDKYAEAAAAAEEAAVE